MSSFVRLHDSTEGVHIFQFKYGINGQALCSALKRARVRGISSYTIGKNRKKHHSLPIDLYIKSGSQRLRAVSPTTPYKTLCISNTFMQRYPKIESAFREHIFTITQTNMHKPPD